MRIRRRIRSCLVCRACDPYFVLERPPTAIAFAGRDTFDFPPVGDDLPFEGPNVEGDHPGCFVWVVNERLVGA